MANELKLNGSLVVGSYSSDPAIGHNGEVYYNTTSNKLRQYINGAWQDISSSSVSLTGQVLNEKNIIVGNSSNASATVDTAASGVIEASTLGLNIKTGAVTNTHISNSAAIAESKLNLDYSTSSLNTNKVSKAGDTMTGALTLSGAPSADLHAATKKYVDDEIAAIDALPSQSGHNGKFLQTDGTNASWQNTSVEFADDVFRIKDNTDATKKIAFEATNITTATTRTITMPDANVNLGALTDSNIDASAAIARSKLATLTANRAMVTDGSGNDSASSVTATELGYVSGVTSAIQTQLNAKIPTSEKAVANGVATLDSGGKVPVSQLPSAVMTYEGTWNASTNSPVLADGTGDAGMVYIVSTAGTQNLGSGSISFSLGDWVVYNGSVWEKSVNSNAVASVNGATGAVTVNAINQLTGDVTAGPASGSQSAAATIAAGAVTAGKLGTITDNVTLDQSGTGSTLQIKAGGITNSHISSSAAISLSKLAGGTANRMVVTDNAGAIATSTAQDVELLSNSFARGLATGNVVTEKFVNSISLADNTGTPTTISELTFDHTVYVGVEICYTIKVGTNIRLGTLRVVSNGTDTSISDVMGEVNNCGVSFTTGVSGSNTQIKFTSTNLGSARTMRADIKFFKA